VNSSDESSWVARAEAAAEADPHLRFEHRDGKRVLVRSESDVGNSLDYTVTYRADSAPSVVFSRSTSGYRIQVDVDTSTGSPGATRISIETPDDEGALDPADLTTINLGRLLAEVNEQLRAPFLRYQLQRHGDAEWSDPFIAVPKPGRKGRPDIDYAIWADRYVSANLQSGGRPLPMLVADFPGYSEDSIRAILNKARRRNLLGASEPGKAGGQLLSRAKELLRSHGLPITSEEEG